MRRFATQGVAVLERVLRDPSLLPEVWWKSISRVTLRRHRKRVDAYPTLASPPADGISKLAGAAPAVIQGHMEAPSLRRLLAELEAYAIPTPARELGGAAFLEACYAVVRLLKPTVVLETGVAHGYSTAAILQALEDNERGTLCSVDLPMFRPGVTSYTGGAIPQRLRASGRWQLLLGPDRRVLPAVLNRVGPVDVFFYDSDKSYEGMLRAWRLLWPHMRPGGVLMVDDVQEHDAFLDFADAQGLAALIIPKPTRRGVYRWDKVYYVGLLHKT
ncbi:MAG: class I SAM-dependent methyltransferase [Armatimonadota bacterium]